ncbi:MAG TPA: methyltransferase domain-containing protein [Gaiellaceae bacterium]|nr:methyltransferase domain-containing protein [Gaiellaceae bacterium]
MSRLDRLYERYRVHHREEKQEFVFGGDERGALFESLVGGPGRRVLDVGCRTGALARYYAPGNEVVGVDVDRDALARARERLGIETHWADVEEGLPFDDASFDVVVMGEVLEHLAGPAAAVATVRRVLRPGGRFVGSVPNAFRLKSRFAYARGRYPGDWDPTHLQLFTPEALRLLLDGFEQVEVRFEIGRFTRLQPRLLANVQVFSARKPG